MPEIMKSRFARKYEQLLIAVLNTSPNENFHEDELDFLKTICLDYFCDHSQDPCILNNLLHISPIFVIDEYVCKMIDELMKKNYGISILPYFDEPYQLHYKWIQYGKKVTSIDETSYQWILKAVEFLKKIYGSKLITKDISNYKLYYLLVNRDHYLDEDGVLLPFHLDKPISAT